MDDERVLIGLVSFGAQSGCEKGYPTVMTFITPFLEWIYESTNNLKWNKWHIPKFVHSLLLRWWEISSRAKKLFLHLLQLFFIAAVSYLSSLTLHCSLECWRVLCVTNKMSSIFSPVCRAFFPTLSCEQFFFLIPSFTKVLFLRGREWKVRNNRSEIFDAKIRRRRMMIKSL